MNHGINNRAITREWRRYDDRRRMLRFDMLFAIAGVFCLGVMTGYAYWQAVHALFAPLTHFAGLH